MKRHLRIDYDAEQSRWGSLVEVAVVACGSENIPCGSSTTDVHDVTCKNCIRTVEYERALRDQFDKEVFETHESVGAGGRI